MKPYKSKFSESQSQENYRDQIKSDKEASNYHSTINRLALDLLDYCGGDESSIDREAENWIDSINDLEEADFAARHISTIKQTAEEFSEEGEMEEEY
jgi:hypothetical protein